MNLQTESTKEKLLNIISSFNTTPFLFIGSGITRRYCNLPSWDLLLEYFSNLLNPSNEFAYANYKRQANNDYSLLGSIIGEEFDNQWFSNQALFEMSTTSKDFIKQGPLLSSAPLPSIYKASCFIIQNMKMRNIY